MNSPAAFAIVHESEAQRQHARVRIPGDIVLITGAGDTQRYKLCDLSAGGFAFESAGRVFKTGELLRGELRLRVDGIGLSVPVQFHVRAQHAALGRTGCAFQDLGPREISALRHLITAYLAGDIVAVGDVLHTLGRDNFTKARALPAGGGLDRPARRRAMALSGLLLMAGAAALLYAAGRLYDLNFVTHATAAKVAAPLFAVSMPRDGVFTSLVPADGLVKKGAPLGSFETAVSDAFDTAGLSRLLSPGELTQLVGQSVKGTITSPCDCRVQARYVGDDQYVGKGQPLFELSPQSFKPYVLARFRHEDIDELTPGTAVTFRISGESAQRSGRIVQLRAVGQGDALDGDIVAQIEPDEALSTEFVSRPVALNTRGLRFTTDALEPGAVEPVALAKAAH